MYQTVKIIVSACIVAACLAVIISFGAFPETENNMSFEKNESVKLFKVFMTKSYGDYNYKLFYYGPEGQPIKSIELNEDVVDIYNSDKGLLIYAGDSKWRLYINQSFPLQGTESVHVVNKFKEETSISEVPLTPPIENP